jgi:hypothetical protein
LEHVEQYIIIEGEDVTIVDRVEGRQSFNIGDVHHFEVSEDRHDR